jgi:DNA polymerase-1
LARPHRAGLASKEKKRMGWNIRLPDAEYYTPESSGLEQIIKEVEAIPEVAIDTETDGLSLWKCRPYYWSLSWETENKERRMCMPASTLPYFQDAFAMQEKRWVFANAKFDAHMLANIGISISGKLVDTQVMHALLYEEQPHGLKDMAKQILGWKWTDFQDTFGKLRKGTCVCSHTETSHKLDKETKDRGYCKHCECSSFKQANPLDQLRRAEKSNMNLLIDYASNDAYGTWKLFVELKKQLEAERTWSAYPDRHPFINTLSDLFFKIEMPFTRVLYTCERNGMRIDRERLSTLGPEIDKDVSAIETELANITGERINPGSTPQLKELFFGTYGCTPTSMTKGGKTGVPQPSVNETFLKHLAGDGTVAGKVATHVLRHRKLTKQKGTYVDGLLSKADPKDRIHGRFNQDVARTGRLSSSDPNLQNITTGEKDEFRLRYAFVPEPGNMMVVADYEQLEMRLLACACLEPKLIDIFLSGKDIHTGNCELVLGIPYQQVEEAKKIDKLVKQGKLPESHMTAEVVSTLEARKNIKIIGFGLNYGMKEKLLAKNMGCSVEHAAETMERYMQTYPAVPAFYEEAIAEAKETGYAFTFLGRRRALHDIWSISDMDRWRAERQAVNLPIQGTAADVCKMAMIMIHDDQLEKKFDCRMLSQVHDEIIFECPKEAAPEVMPIIQEWMEHPFPTDMEVPLSVDIGAGSSWGAAK